MSLSYFDQIKGKGKEKGLDRSNLGVGKGCNDHRQVILGVRGQRSCLTGLGFLNIFCWNGNICWNGKNLAI